MGALIRAYTSCTSGTISLAGVIQPEKYHSCHRRGDSDRPLETLGQVEDQRGTELEAPGCIGLQTNLDAKTKHSHHGKEWNLETEEHTVVFCVIQESYVNVRK